MRVETRRARAAAAAVFVLATSQVACSTDNDTDSDTGADTSSSDVAPDSAADDTDVGGEDVPDSSEDVCEECDAEADIDVDDEALLDADVVPQLSDLTVIPNPANVLSAFVEWRTDVPATSDVRVSCALGEETFELDASNEAANTTHRVFVMGAITGAECEVEVASGNAAGVAEDAASWTVGDLPDALAGLADTLEVVERDVEAIEPGWTLLNLNNRFTGQPLWAVMVDDQGRFRWYYRNAENGEGSDNEIKVVDLPTRQGVLIGGTRGTVYAKLVAWDGSVAWQRNTRMHHDIRVIDGGARLAYLVDGGPCDLEHNSGGIDIATWEDATPEWSWRLCDVYTPPSVFPDWAHINTLEPTPEGWLISARDQYTLFHIDGETGEILWSVGERGTIETSTEDGTAFWRQHAPELQPGGTIVLFDNGHGTHRPSSRLLELAVDPEEGTVEVVWEWSPDPVVFAPIWGDADRLANGNTLGTFGLRSDTEPSHLYEVTAEGEVAWHLRLPPGWGSYRADRVPERLTATFE